MSLNGTMTPWQEHLFWVEILQDHAIFVDQALAPGEVQWVAIAQRYIAAFTELRNRILKTDPLLPVSSETMIRLSRDIYPVAHGYYQFEGYMQHLRIQNKVVLSLTPVYFNGTLLENGEYLRILHNWMNGVPYEPLPLVTLTEMWLEDQLGHTVLLENHLDPTEIELVRSTQQYAQHFEAHIVKNNAIRGFLRFTPPNFTVQMKFARQVAETVIGFYHLVEKVIREYEHSELLSRLTLRFLEHHLPETCYFLHKLADYNIEILGLTNCPLTEPSFE
ncbi:DUF2935 domain-containing protein [Paenibacillus sp. SYP-B3998]|uniref:DUF2935 domain-containing protein n=1 Tax=Paenibacillus sp. SYP-B3998 TaxID=2678564 RepID=A0A6G3ZXQ9_9BACL|nr:DUF2935 domain-containing protein [Paenibacillus sp. SYP-B3998]NEW07006.1 DUF2935 domain-containing protein [Paenibacillus sp. SYP-B3998]